MSIGRIAGKSAAEQLIGIEEMLRKQNGKHLEQAQNVQREKLEPAAVQDAVRAAGTNVMSGNFAGNRDSGSSRYVEASLQSMQQLRQQKNAMVAQIWAEADDLGGAQGGSRKQLQRGRLSEKLNESNEEIREDIERKAQEAQAPKDAEGNPIPGASIGTGAEVPQISQPSAAPAPDMTPAEPEVQVAAPQVSIDITV